jgi:F0F1-type ATP synthase assembly protein I
MASMLGVEEGGGGMKRWMAAILATATVIISSFGGLIVGAIVGSLIVPVRLFDLRSDPSGLIAGAILGLLGGFYFGMWAAAGILDRAAAKRRRPREPSTQNAGSLEDRFR